MISNRFIKTTSGAYNTRNNCGVTMMRPYIKNPDGSDPYQTLVEKDLEHDEKIRELYELIRNVNTGESTGGTDVNEGLLNEISAQFKAVDNELDDHESRIKANETDILEVDETLTKNYTAVNEQLTAIDGRIKTLEDKPGCTCPSDVESRLTTLEEKPGCACPSDVESRLTTLEGRKHYTDVCKR